MLVGKSKSASTDMFKTLLAVALAAVLTLVSAQTITGQYDCLPAGAYTLCQNLWGECTSNNFWS